MHSKQPITGKPSVIVQVQHKLCYLLAMGKVARCKLSFPQLQAAIYMGKKLESIMEKVESEKLHQCKLHKQLAITLVHDNLHIQRHKHNNTLKYTESSDMQKYTTVLKQKTITT